MSNYHLSDTRISLKAVGLLSKMLSLPETWNYSITGLIAICKENETAIRNTLNELKEYGYLQINKNRNPRGYFEYEYIVSEFPQDNNRDLDNSDVENLHMDNLDVEKQAQLITKELNTEKLNTKELNTYSFLEKEKKSVFKKTDNISEEEIKPVDKFMNNIEEHKEISASPQKKADPYITTPVETYFKNEYKKIFNNNVYITTPLRNKLLELNSDIEDFKETIPLVLKRLKNIKFTGIDFTPSANWLLKGENYTSILNGEYETEEKKKKEETDRLFAELKAMNDKKLGITGE